MGLDLKELSATIVAGAIFIVKRGSVVPDPAEPERSRPMLAGLSAWVGAIGTLLSAMVALFQLWRQVQRKQASRRAVLLIMTTFGLSLPLAIYGGVSAYANYRRAYDTASRVSKIAAFAPGLSPAYLNMDLEENADKEVYIEEPSPPIPDALKWYEVKRAPDRLTQSTPLSFNLPQDNRYLYYESKLDKARWGWSAISLTMVEPVSLAQRSRLFFIIRAQRADKLEVKLIDVHRHVNAAVMPVVQGWGAYTIALADAFRDVDLNRVQTLQVAHSSYLVLEPTNTFHIALVGSR